MYDSTYPRSHLGGQRSATVSRSVTEADGIAAATYHDVSRLRSTYGTATVAVRAQNVVRLHTRLTVGEVLDLGTLSAEAALVITDVGLVVDLVTDEGVTRVSASGSATVPPGSSRVVARRAGELICLAKAGQTRWAEAAVNAADYAEDHPRVALLQPCPEPLGGHRVRVYRLSDVPADPQRFGRIFPHPVLHGQLPDAPGRSAGSGQALTPCPRRLRAGVGRRRGRVRPSRAHPVAEGFHRLAGGRARPDGGPVGGHHPAAHRAHVPGGGDWPQRHAGHLQPAQGDLLAEPGWVLNADEYPAP